MHLNLAILGYVVRTEHLNNSLVQLNCVKNNISAITKKFKEMWYVLSDLFNILLKQIISFALLKSYSLLKTMTGSAGRLSHSVCLINTNSNFTICYHVPICE